MLTGIQFFASPLKSCKSIPVPLLKCLENRRFSQWCSNLFIFNKWENSKQLLRFGPAKARKTAFHNGQIGIAPSVNVSNSCELFEKEMDIKVISKGDPDVERKLKVLLLEMEVLRQEGHLVPDLSVMKPEYWEELLNLNSRSGRRKYLQFLFKKSKTIENKKLKKKKPKLEERKQETEDSGLQYGLQGNNIFLRFYDTTINHMYNNRLIQAMQFGQKLILDCGYEKYMVKRENVNCAKQLMLLFADNRYHDDPFDLHLCNMQNNGDLRRYVKRQIPTMDESWFPLNIHEESYLDLFPKDQLIYLTPHCRNEMEHYDHDAIYIIGALVDKVNTEPLSLAKAKKENLRMVKLPLDRYLQWGAGSGKSLTLNQCISILLDVKRTNDWKYALRHVPCRKISNNFASIENHNRQISRFQKIWKPKHNITGSVTSQNKSTLEDNNRNTFM